MRFLYILKSVILKKCCFIVKTFALFDPKISTEVPSVHEDVEASPLSSLSLQYVVFFYDFPPVVSLPVYPIFCRSSSTPAAHVYLVHQDFLTRIFYGFNALVRVTCPSHLSLSVYFINFIVIPSTSPFLLQTWSIILRGIFISKAFTISISFVVTGQSRKHV